jgi:hypothetical protein
MSGPRVFDPGDAVGWSPIALAKRAEPDRPYAAQSRGVVLRPANGGWAVVVEWPWGVRVSDCYALVCKAIV